LTLVADKVLADMPEMEKEQQDLLQEALRLQTELLQEEVTTPGDRNQLALTHHRVGKLLRELLPADLGSSEGKQKSAQARQAFEQAIVEFSRLAQEAPGEDSHQIHLAACRNDLGELLHDLKEVAQARKEFRAAEEELRKLPATAARQRELARSLN